MSFSSQPLICGHDSLSQRRITCYWLEGQTVVMRKGIMGFHFRASWLSNTKVSLCVYVLMIHCFFSMPFIFLSHKMLQPVIDSAAFFCLLLFLSSPPTLSLQHITVQLSCYTQAQLVLLSQTFVHVVHQTQVERPPLACQLEDINQFKKTLAELKWKSHFTTKS